MASSARIDELRNKFDENPRRYFAPLANEFRKAGDPEQAIFICEEYLPQQPGHMSGHIVYGQALYELNKHDDARGVFETALSLDPENLIALRHLGDIARLGGDPTTARMWYQRVLEADPRNEEIAQLMLSLLNDSPGANPTSMTPRGTTAVEADASDSAEIQSESIAEPELVVEQSIDPPLPVTPPAPVYEETRRVSPHAPKESDLLDLDDFDLGGVPLSELRAASATPIYQPAQPFDPSQPFDESTASGIAMPEMYDAEEHRGVDETQAVHSESSEAEASLETHSHDVSSPEASPLEAASVDAESDNPDAFEAGFTPYTPAFGASAATSASDEIEKDDDTPIGASSESNSEAFVASFMSTSYTEHSYHDIETETPPADTQSEPDLEAAFESSFEPGLTSAFEAAPEPVVESATDLHLGLTGDGTAETTVGSSDGSSDDAAGSSLDGLETFEAGAFSAAPVASPAIEMEPFFETTPVSDEPPEEFVESALGTSTDATDATDAIGGSELSELDATDAPVYLFESSNYETQEPADGSSADESAIGLDLDASTIEVVSDQAEAAAHVPSAFSDEPTSSTEEFESESFAQTTEVFATETMAQLYLEQGHLESALVIYRKLVEQRPSDEDLAARMDAIEERMAVSADERSLDEAFNDESIDDGASDVVPARSYGGPTIREFLSGLVNRVASNVAQAEPPRDASDEYEVRDEHFDTPVDDFDVVSADAVPRDTPSHTSEATLGGSLDALFAGANADAADAAAADRLAQAFETEETVDAAAAEMSTMPSTPGRSELEGLPAHRAADELSLDHVFKTQGSSRGGSTADGFSFDQFFSEEVSEGVSDPIAESSAPAPQGADDIAQFNAWLNGLKKS